MRRPTQALWLLYGALAVGLLGCALVSYQAEQMGYVMLFTAGAVTAALAIVHTSWLLDEYRSVLEELDRARPPQRPRRLVTRQDTAVQKILAADCCEVWWSTAGTEHDPEHCTRKDAGA